MGNDEPTFFCLERRTAITDLNKLPRKLRFCNQMDFIMPIGNGIGEGHITVFSIYPA